MQDVVTGQLDPAPTGPVILIGAPESGSAVLRSALNRHPHLAIAAETGFLRAVSAAEWIPFWKFGGLWYGRLGLSQEQLYEQLRGFYGGLFAEFAERQGKRRWGDETPLHAWHVREAAQLFGNATFVATVRHPAAVAASLQERCGYTRKRSLRVWTQTNLELVHCARELSGRFLLCRSEDLLADPERTLRELLAELREPWSPAVLDAAGGLEQASQTQPLQSAGSARPRRRVAALASFFGYDIQDPSWLGPLTKDPATSRVVLTGDDLAAQADRTDSVDWSVRPRPPTADQPLNPKRVTVVKVHAAGRPPRKWAVPRQRASRAAAAAGARGGPIFLVGSMGSGTTLIRLMLDSHERIAIPPETGFMRAVAANRSIPFWRPGGDWYDQLGISKEELNAELRRLYGGMFERFAQQQGKQRWGEKTPYHTWHMTEIARLFPDAVFIGMVRHPGGATTSLHNRFKFSWPRAVTNWRRLNMGMVERAAALGDRFLLCRYEDLVLEPESTMRELLDWLGEPWSANVLAHHVVHGDRPAPTVVEGRTCSTDPIDVARVAFWATSLDPEAAGLLHDKTAALAHFFGYHFDDATRFDALVPPGGSSRRSVVTGTELAQRREQFGDEVNWSARPRLGLVDRTLDPRWLAVARVKPGKAQPRRTRRNKPASSRGQVVTRRAARAVASRLPDSVAPQLRGLANRARSSALRRLVRRGP